MTDSGLYNLIFGGGTKLIVGSSKSVFILNPKTLVNNVWSNRGVKLECGKNTVKY